MFEQAAIAVQDEQGFAQLHALIDAVFDARDRGPHRAALTLQCGLALYIAGRASSIASGIGAAGAAIDNGQARRWLQRLRQFAAASP